MANGLELLFIAKSSMMRNAWASLLQSYPGLHCLTIFKCASDAIKYYSMPARQPELVIIENRLSEQEGLFYLNQVKAEWPDVPCIILTDSLKQYQMVRAAGASAVVTSGQPVHKIFDVIGKLVSPEL